MNRIFLGVIAVAMVGCASPFEGPGPVFPVSAQDREGTAYFPQALREATLRCGLSGRAARRAIMDEFVAGSYTEFLAAAGEAPLFRRAGPSLRFTWLRTFDAPVVIRVDTGADGAVTMTATELSGRGGYEPGTVARRIERQLSAEEATALRQRVEETAVLKQAPATCAAGLDGARWIVESAGPDGYRFVDRQSPADGPVHTFGLHLIGLTGWTYDKIY
jgi:hypothetical protein